MKLAEKQEFSSKLYTGFASNVEVVAINPTKAQLAAIKGYELREPQEGKEIKDFEYEGKDANGDEYVDITAYVKINSHPDKPIMQIRNRFVDKDVISEKEENGVKTIKYQWVNQQGGSTWVDDKKNLLEKFTNVQVKGENVADREYRLAIQGEANFYGFLQAWLDKGVSFFGEASKDTDIFIDKKKMFRNIEKYVDSEIRPLIGSVSAGNFNILTMVGISEKDGKVNHFQNVYNNFWPEWKFKSMTGAINTGDWNLTLDTIKNHEYLVKSLKKSAYTLGWIKEFVESEHLNAGTETFKSAPEDTEGNDENLY